MDFVEVARYSSRLEAETIGHALDAQDIPFLVQSADAGGMFENHMIPARLMVPADRADEVRTLLACAVDPVDDTERTDIPPETKPETETE